MAGVVVTSSAPAIFMSFFELKNGFPDVRDVEKTSNTEGVLFFELKIKTPCLT